MRKHGDTKIIVNRVSECFRIFCLAVGAEIGLLLRSCFEFLQKVFLGLMYPFSCVLWAIFWFFSLLFSSHDKFKTASKMLSAKPSDYFDKFFPITFFLVFANAAYFSKGIDGSRSGRG